MKNEETKIKNDIIKIFSKYYEDSMNIAKINTEARVYTDHNDEHVNMVLNKTLEVIKAITQFADSIYSSFDDDSTVFFSKKVKEKIVIAISMLHDVGLCGYGYAYDNDLNGDIIKSNDYYRAKKINSDNYSEIRMNHGLNSAVIVLENRKNLKKIGYTDVEIDEIAVVCMSHFISTSGVKDINSIADWKECFDRIDSVVFAYNRDNLDKKIFFNRKNLENEAYLAVLATEALGVRLGDVSRDSNANAISQSGEVICVDRQSLNNEAGFFEGEIENANITIGKSKEQIISKKSRQVHVGEQNIVGNHTFLGGKNTIVHEITINDVNSAPKCTQIAICDHLRVLSSAKNVKFDVVIKFKNSCTNYAKKSYENFKEECAKLYMNSNIIYFWG